MTDPEQNSRASAKFLRLNWPWKHEQQRFEPYSEPTGNILNQIEGENIGCSQAGVSKRSPGSEIKNQAI